MERKGKFQPDDFDDPQELETSDEQSELYEHHRFVVDKGQSHYRIDKFLKHKIPYVSRTKIQAAAAAGNILVNENIVSSNYKVKPFDVISIVMAYPPREIELVAEDIPVNIVYEDDDLVIINKEAGMVVHPGVGNHTGTLVNALAWHFKDLPMFGSDNLRPGLVHRIDKNTSGLILVAKNEISKNKLAKQFFDHTTHRRYIALVWGDFKEDSGTITGHIGRSVRDRKVMDIYPDGSFGKHAVTHYTVLKRYNFVSIVECRLETGRTHQIRAHMQHIGHPLFNDWEYGGDKIWKGLNTSSYKKFIENCFALCPRQALHAKEIGFVHPSTKEFVKFDSDLSGDMTCLIEKWERYMSGDKNDIN